jgi:hypothetical protein
MPRGNPKPVITVRLDRALTDEVRRYTANFTDAVEEGLMLWLKQKRRKAEPLARRLAPPTARQRAVRGGKAA